VLLLRTSELELASSAWFPRRLEGKISFRELANDAELSSPRVQGAKSRNSATRSSRPSPRNVCPLPIRSSSRPIRPGSMNTFCRQSQAPRARPVPALHRTGGRANQIAARHANRRRFLNGRRRTWNPRQLHVHPVEMRLPVGEGKHVRHPHRRPLLLEAGAFCPLIAAARAGNQRQHHPA
jgi:hypothetical protein